MKLKNKKSRPSNWAVFLIVTVVLGVSLFVYSHHRTTSNVSTATMLATIHKQKFVSTWICSQNIPASSQRKILADIKRDEARPDKALWLNQAALLYPTIERLCRSENLDPTVITGLIIQESQGSPLAVDYAFTGGSTKYSHIGLGQLSSGRLPKLLPRLSKKQVTKKLQRIAHLAFQWRKHRQEASAKIFLNQWVKEDPRFDALSNLTQTIKEFKDHQLLSGDTTLAIMAHHGGGSDPLKRVALYRHYVDPTHPPVSLKSIAQYVHTHHLNYFILAESKDKGSRYWSEKGDGHLAYCSSVIAWTEMFCRFRASSLASRQKTEQKYPGGSAVSGG